jgi:hypothetical protein
VDSGGGARSHDGGGVRRCRDLHRLIGLGVSLEHLAGADPASRSHRARPHRDHGCVRQHLGRELGVPRARPRLRDAPRSDKRNGPRDDPCRRRAARSDRGGGIDMGAELRRRVVSRIDPGTNAVSATIHVCDAPEGLAGTPGSVWVVCEDDDVVGRIYPATDRMVETVEVGLSPRFALSAFGSVWVSNFVEGSVSRIDPLAGKVVATIDVESEPQLMVATPDGVWVSNADAPAVQRIDQRSTAVVATLEDAGTTPDGLVEFDGAVWVASDPGPQLHRIDRRTRRLTGRGRSRTRGPSAPTSCSSRSTARSGSRSSTRVRSCRSSRPPEFADGSRTSARSGQRLLSLGLRFRASLPAASPSSATRPCPHA